MVSFGGIWSITRAAASILNCYFHVNMHMRNMSAAVLVKGHCLDS